MFLEIRHGTLYVDGRLDSDGCDSDSSVYKALWVEGDEVPDEYRFPLAFYWTQDSGKVEAEWRKYADQSRYACKIDAWYAIIAALVAAIGMYALTWSLLWLMIVVPCVLVSAGAGLHCSSEWTVYKKMCQRYQWSELRVIEFDYDVITRIRWLIQSDLAQNVRDRLEIGVHAGGIKKLVDIDDDSVARVIQRNPELIEFISKECSAELPSPEEYRRRAFDVLYGYIQDEINRLKANQAIATEQQRIEAEQEAVRRSRKEREAAVQAEANRALRVLSLPSILNETEDEVRAWGSLSQAMQDDSSLAPDLSKEPKKA